MNQINNKINDILCRWNPIGVPDKIAQSEYVSYIPRILERLQQGRNIQDCLIEILVDDMGFAYDSNNPLHKQEIESIAQEISLAYQA